MKRFITAVLCLCILSAAAVPALAATDGDTVQQTIIALGIMTGDEHGNMNLSAPVTRAQFAKMLIMASEYKDTVQEGSGFSPFKDVKYTHWAADYIKTAVSAGWVTGYVDGTFRPDATITFEESASAILKLLGYGASDLAGSYPGAQISKFRSLKLDSGVTLEQGKKLTRSDCMYIFYNLMGASNKNGAVHGVTLGYTMNSSGEIDYDELVKADIEGPFIMTGTSLSSIVPFNTSQAEIYRNNTLAAENSAGQYDVVYYNVNTKTVWVYSNRVIGMYTAVTPNAVSPTGVTVAGVSYTLGTSAAKNKVGTTGQFAIGDTVALLLGMDGDVVDIISATEVDGSYYGVVTGLELTTYSTGTSTSNAEYILSVACTDGVVRQCAVSGNHFSEGNLVSVSYAKGELTVAGLSVSGLTGKFSSDGRNLGDYKLADNAEIIEVSPDGAWKTIYPQRLAGAELTRGHIRFHALNSAKEITHLILGDVTGDMYTYGILTSVIETNEPASIVPNDPSSSVPKPIISGEYGYLIDGKTGVINSSRIYRVDRGGAIFSYKSDGVTLSSIKNLAEVRLNEISILSASGGNKKFGIADGIQVYLKSGESYHATELSALNTEDYTLTGYYEETFPAGGQIRIIVAVKK